MPITAGLAAVNVRPRRVSGVEVTSVTGSTSVGTRPACRLWVPSVTPMVIARRGRETVVVPSWEIPAFAGISKRTTHPLMSDA